MNDDQVLPALTFHPATPDRWEDFETVFGPRGGTGGCWCMYWRLKHSEFEAQKGDTNKQLIKGIIKSGHIPGIIAYAGDEPVGWCSVAPREEFSRLERSRILKPVDEQPVWSIVCFFIPRKYRRKGVMKDLLSAAVDFAQSQGAKIIEGYPVEPKKDTMPDVFAWTGFAQAFIEAGFKEVARRSETRPVMRYFVGSIRH